MVLEAVLQSFVPLAASQLGPEELFKDLKPEFRILVNPELSISQLSEDTEYNSACFYQPRSGMVKQNCGSKKKNRSLLLFWMLQPLFLCFFSMYLSCLELL